MATQKKVSKQIPKQDLPTVGTLQGRVTSVNVKGYEVNSGQLLVTIETGGPDSITMPLFAGIPIQEGAVFSALTSFFTLAYLSQEKVGVTYLEAEPTNFVVEAFFPASKRDKKRKK